MDETKGYLPINRKAKSNGIAFVTIINLTEMTHRKMLELLGPHDLSRIALTQESFSTLAKYYRTAFHFFFIEVESK